MGTVNVCKASCS